MSYCSKCKQEVQLGDCCSLCGKKLTAASRRLSFVYGNTPLFSRISWHGALRILIPVLLIILIVIIVSEGLSGGINAVQVMIMQDFPVIASVIIVGMAAVIVLILFLQGPEYLQYIIDSKGVHAYTFIENATIIRCALRLQNPIYMEQPNSKKKKAAQTRTEKIASDERNLPMKKARPAWVGERHILWQDIKRIRLCKRRNTIALYSSKHRPALVLQCIPGSYDDALNFIQSKTKKNTELWKP